MGRSADAKMFFGVITEDGTEFPWHTEEHENDIDVWWENINGFKASVNPWAKGAPTNGPLYQRECEQYFAEKAAWQAEHPLPVELLNVQSAEYATWALAVPTSIRSAEWGEPQAFDPDALAITMDQRVAFDEFLVKYKIPHSGVVGWFLGAYYG